MYTIVNVLCLCLHCLHVVSAKTYIYIQCHTFIHSYIHNLKRDLLQMLNCRICDKIIVDARKDGRKISEALSLTISNYFEVDVTKDGEGNSTHIHHKCMMNVSLIFFSN